MPAPQRHNGIAQALMETLISPNVSDSNLEAANLVDVGDRIGDALWKLARTGDLQSSPGTLELHGDAIKDAARMLAEALESVADAIRSLRA